MSCLKIELKFVKHLSKSCKIEIKAFIVLPIWLLNIFIKYFIIKDMLSSSI